MPRLDPERAASPDIVPVRKTFRVGRFVIGRQFDPVESLAPESDELDTEVSPPAGVYSSNGASGHTSAQQAPFTRFTAQRPIIYSGAGAGFFENEKTQAVLAGFESVARPALVPHATVIERSLIRKAITNRPDVPLQAIVSECRRAADTLPDRHYGHIDEVIARGSLVLLRLDWIGGHRLAQDTAQLCDRFGVPFDSDQKVFFPHVTVARARDAETADQIAEELNPVISPSEGPKANAIGFGGVTVLYG